MKEKHLRKFIGLRRTRAHGWASFTIQIQIHPLNNSACSFIYLPVTKSNRNEPLECTHHIAISMLSGDVQEGFKYTLNRLLLPSQ